MRVQTRNTQRAESCLKIGVVGLKALVLLTKVDTCQQKVLEEYLRVIRVVIVTITHIHGLPDGSILGIMPLQLPWREVLCGRVATSCVILLGFPRWNFPRNGMSGKETSPCCNVFREKEKILFEMQEKDLRGAYCNLPPCS